MSLADNSSVLCPMCSAENRRDATECFLCGRSLAGATDFVPSKPSAKPEARHRPTFRIRSITLTIALIAFFLGVFLVAPGAAILLAIPGTMALIRISVIANRRPGPLRGLEYAAVFFGMFATVAFVAIAAGVSFFLTCKAFVDPHDAYGGDSLGTGLLAGAIVGVPVIIGFTVAFVRLSRWARLR